VTARLTRGAGGPKRLRELLDSGETIVAPGAFDPLAARLVEEAGFPAVYMTGFGTSAALLGRPDVGLLTMTEMAGNAGRIAACVDIPVIADADTGYGNPLNVIRTVGAYETAGVAGIHIEDQVAPKKCGHMEGKQVIAPDEMAQKVRAAADARFDKDFVIIARTDARAVEGLDRALERAAAGHGRGGWDRSPHRVRRRVPDHDRRQGRRRDRGQRRPLHPGHGRSQGRPGGRPVVSGVPS